MSKLTQMIKDTHKVNLSTSTTGQLRKVLTDGGATPNEAEAILRMAAGCTIGEALVNTGCYPDTLKNPDDTAQMAQHITRFKNRMGTLFSSVLSAAVGDHSETYGFTRTRGRTANPAIAAMRKAGPQAMTDARKTHNVGRITANTPSDMLRKINKTAISNFTSALTEIRKEHGTIPGKNEEMIERYLTSHLVSEEAIALRVVTEAIEEAAEMATAAAQDQFGLTGNSSVEAGDEAEWNKTAVSTFKSGLQEVRKEHGTLPGTNDELIAQYLELYEVSESKPKSKKSSKPKTEDDMPDTETEEEAVSEEETVGAEA